MQNTQHDKRTAAPKVQSKVNNAGRGRSSRMRFFRMVTFPRVVFAITVACTCVAFVYSNMQLTSLTKLIGEQETALAQAESEYISLKSRQGQALSISYVEQYAKEQLGMVKMDPAQIEYVEITKPEVTEVSNTNKVGDAVASLMRGFTSVLEYLR